MDVYKIVHYLHGFTDQKLEMLYCRSADKLYFFHTEMLDGCLYIWVSFLGSDEEAGQSSVLISVGNDPDVWIDWKVPIHSIHTRFRDIQSFAHCAMIPKLYLRNFCKQDKSDEEYYGLEIHFQIENI